ncbi:MAG: right-handed parallel beta-helix repeat-containing protein, partial [Candidatus Margulisiibacteriota bacterium]
MKKFVAASAIFLFCMAGMSFGATYYVNASSGNDDNAGGVGDPWKTVTRASTTAATGDTINIAAGRYDASNGEHYPLTFAGETWVGAGAGLTTLESIPTGDDNMITLEAGVKLQDLDISYGYTGGTTRYAIYSRESGNARISNCHIYATPGYSVTNAIYVTASSLTVENSTLSNFTGSYGVFIFSGLSSSNTVSIESCSIRNITSQAMQFISGSGAKVDLNNCKIYASFSSTSGIGVTVSAASPNVTIRHCTFANMKYGVYSTGAPTFTIRDSIFSGPAVLNKIEIDGSLAINKTNGTFNYSY